MSDKPLPLLNLESCLATGATLNGFPVAKIKVTLTDGRIQRLELPAGDRSAETAADFPSLEDLPTMILRTLEKLRPGEWMNGAAIALMIDETGNTEHSSGSFYRAVKKLKEDEKIESDKKKGYRLLP